MNKGFTLVELAIVMAIIGLLVGGVLKGQQLLANAKVTAQIKQFNQVESASLGFRDKYNYLPGGNTAYRFMYGRQFLCEW